MKTVKQLRAEQKRLQDFLASAPDEEKALDEKLSGLGDKLETVLAIGMRSGDESEVDQVRADIRKTKDDLEDLRLRMKVAKGQVRDIESEVVLAQHEESRRLKELRKNLEAPVMKKLQSDKKLRASLIEIFAYNDAQGRADFGRAIWGNVLERIFPHPSDDEWRIAMTKARKALGLEDAA